MASVRRAAPGFDIALEISELPRAPPAEPVEIHSDRVNSLTFRISPTESVQRGHTFLVQSIQQLGDAVCRLVLNPPFL